MADSQRELLQPLAALNVACLIGNLLSYLQGPYNADRPSGGAPSLGRLRMHCALKKLFLEL